MAKIEMFPLCIGYSCTTMWVKNLLEIALSLSLTVLKIFTLFHFHFQNPRWPPKEVKIEIFPLATGYSCTTMWVKYLLEIALSLTVFEIFVIFFTFSIKVAIK